jgi:hypothetical protein
MPTRRPLGACQALVCKKILTACRTPPPSLTLFGRLAFLRGPWADHDIIFGMDWLRAHNPEVNWTLPQVSFTRCPKECTLSQTPLIITSQRAQTRSTTINAIQPSTPEEDTSEPSYTYEAFTAFEETLSGHKYYISVRASTTTSTQIAMCNMPKSTVTTIPEQFHRYTKIFSEEASQCLPKHQSWDHAINLIPGATIKKCGIYRLTPKEMDALCEHLADQLEKGYIRYSKSPMPSSLFFVEKKGGALRPVQDCHWLNDITIKNTAPIPLIPCYVSSLSHDCLDYIALTCHRLAQSVISSHVLSIVTHPRIGVLGFSFGLSFKASPHYVYKLVL